MIRIKKGVFAGILFFCLSDCVAGNIPVSKEYVDHLFLKFQKKIDALTPIFSVGRCYGGGVIFYVNPNADAAAGQRGLIVALNDLPAGGYAWADDPTIEVSPTSLFLFQGLANTTTILATPGTTFPAAQAAHDYSTSQNCATCTSWYLPSEGELSTLILQQNLSGLDSYCGASNLSSDSGYWTSSGTYDDGGTKKAYFVGQADAAVALSPLDFENPVRPIRAF